MGVEFGKTMLAGEPDPEVVICLINHAVGGTAIQWWEPGVTNTVYTNPSTGEFYTLYDEAIQRVTAASSFGVVKGVLWHQGEYNSNAANEFDRPNKPAGDPGGYALRLHTLVDNLRRDLDRPGLPFICGELVPNFDSPQLQFRDTVEAALADLPNHRANTFCVENDGLSGNIGLDEIHFNAPSQRLLGQRYAGAMEGFLSDPYLLWLGAFLSPAEMSDAVRTNPKGDYDHDGFENFLEFSFLSDPTEANSTPAIIYNFLQIPGNGVYPALTFRRRLTSGAPEYLVEISSDLVTWTSNLDSPLVTETVGSPVDHEDGTATVTIRSLTSMTSGSTSEFLRIKVLASP